MPKAKRARLLSARRVTLPPFCASSSKTSEHGSALIEFSLLILVLLLLALGVFDFGFAIEQGIVVASAAHAGAEYGAAEGNCNNTAGMQSAAMAAAPGIANFSATATTWCVCVAGSSSVIPCTTNCNIYDLPIQYVQVQTSASVPVLIPFTGLPPSISLTGVSTMRAR
jgi:Flp pilus assembly protein TadG